MIHSNWNKKVVGYLVVLGVLAWTGCAHKRIDTITPDEAARLDRKLVRNAVIFDPGTEEGASIPEISAPALHARWVYEGNDGKHLVEKHREWVLEGECTILGLPEQSSNKASGGTK